MKLGIHKIGFAGLFFSVFAILSCIVVPKKNKTEVINDDSDKAVSVEAIKLLETVKSICFAFDRITSPLSGKLSTAKSDQSTEKPASGESLLLSNDQKSKNVFSITYSLFSELGLGKTTIHGEKRDEFHYDVESSSSLEITKGNGKISFELAGKILQINQKPVPIITELSIVITTNQINERFQLFYRLDKDNLNGESRQYRAILDLDRLNAFFALLKRWNMYEGVNQISGVLDIQSDEEKMSITGRNMVWAIDVFNIKFLGDENNPHLILSNMDSENSLKKLDINAKIYDETATKELGNVVVNFSDNTGKADDLFVKVDFYNDRLDMQIGEN